VRPYLPLAERLGRLFAALNDGLPAKLDVEYQGSLADYDTRILTLSVLKGLFAAGSDEPVSYVNAPQLAEERGLEYRESKTSTAHDYVNLVTLRGADHALAGTLFGLRGEPRIVMVDDHDIELPVSRHMLAVRNDDRVGMIALVTTALAEASINIADLKVGRSPTGGTALMVLSVDKQVPADLVSRLAETPGILDVHAVTDA
jgi:D-3-phosphoglycerate dehydrogenase / 2-oxoglutarate reductase